MAVVGAVLVTGAPPPAAAAQPTIIVSAPQYESPGGTVPTIVTVGNVPSGYRADIGAEGTNGATATCVGEPWANPVRATVSRKCYLQLPTRAGSYNVHGHAVLSRPGAVTITTSGTGSRPVLGNGYVSATPMPLDRIQRIERCANATDDVWLTFDDGGSDAQVRSILTTLRTNNVRGRFFFRGDWAASNPVLMHQIVADGHLLGNHTYSHAPLSQTADIQVRTEIQRGVGATTAPRLLRPPFAAGAFTSRLDALARQEGYELCRWTMDTYDWDRASPALMVERLTHGDYRSPPVAAGGNILLHGGGAHTAEGLQAIINAVRARGLRLDALRATTDRTHTAAAISAHTHPHGAETVYLTTARNFPDALAGGPAAARDGAPILLVYPDRIPSATAEELQRLSPVAVVVLGGPGAVSEEVARDAGAMTGATVRRLAAGDRFATAVAIARHTHPGPTDTVYLVTGQNFPDALAASPAAAVVDQAPILLVTRDRVPEATAEELQRLDPGRVIVVGGPGAVSNAIIDHVRQRTAAIVERVSGTDRVATAAALARYSHPGRATSVFVATARDFPDAMTAGPAAAGNNAPILLVGRDRVPQATADELRRLAPETVMVIGGPAAISERTAAELAEITGAAVHRLSG